MVVYNESIYCNELLRFSQRNNSFNDASMIGETLEYCDMIKWKILETSNLHKDLVHDKHNILFITPFLLI